MKTLIIAVAASAFSLASFAASHTEKGAPMAKPAASAPAAKAAPAASAPAASAPAAKKTSTTAKKTHKSASAPA